MGNKIHVLLIIVIALAFLTSCTAPQNEITGSAIQQQDIPEESITTNASSEAIVSAAVAEPSSEDIKAEPIENEEASVIDSQTIVEKTNAEDTNAQPSAKQLTEETPAKETFNHIPDDVLNNYDKICSKISFVEYKNKCYTQAASLKKDIEICKKVDDSTYLDTPECYSTIAYVTGNKSICDNVKSRNAHYICISGVAIATNNETICNDQESFVMKEDCIRNIAAIRHDAELCNKLQQKPAREWCYALVAQATGNKELCNNISKEDTLRRLGCKMALLDKQYYRGSCLGLGPELARDYCFYAHEESTKNMKITEDYELCNGASTDFKQKAACLANLAYVNGNPSYCNELNVTSDHDFCVRVAAGTKREVSYCYNLTVDVQHDLCIADVAVYTKNLTLCNTINNSRRRNECLQYLGVALNDPQICKNATEIEDRSRCLRHVGKATKDLEVCDMIEVQTTRNHCYYSTLLAEDDWKYDCGWVPDWSLMYVCFFAKEEGVKLGNT